MANKISVNRPSNGDIFGAWTVIDSTPINKRVLCRCRCAAEKLVNHYNLVTGKTTSCGCESKYRAKKHGLSATPEYQIWKAIKARCYNNNHKNYADYGGRGIKMCDEWINSPEAFISSMGKRPLGHSIERNNHNGDYEPGNCRWASQQEQMRNTRRSSTIIYNGQKKTVAEWAEVTGIAESTLYHRLYAGWSAERTIETPVPKMKK